MKRRPLLIPFVALALVACAAQPMRYYTLVAPPSPTPTPAAAIWVDLMPVSVPAQVDAPQLVVRQGSGQLALLERDQWAAPLDAEIRDALAAELSRRAGVRDAHTLAAPKGQALYRLKLDVQRFDSIPGRAVHWDTAWSLNGAGEQTLSLACSFSATETVESGYPAMVEGHQRIVAKLAVQIAAVLDAVRQGTAVPVCR
jgi:uncharacterized lipoprotein YmbA